jgi:hypothetical protein
VIVSCSRHFVAPVRGAMSVALAVAATVALASCARTTTPRLAPTPSPGGIQGQAFLDTVEQRSFEYFWRVSDPRTGLTPDRALAPTFSSIAAIGFALTAYPIGAERGYVTRDAAAERTLATLRFLWTAPQSPDDAGAAGFKGFFYHFLDMKTGGRFGPSELSTIDTALLLAGALFAQGYFDAPTPVETAIRATADSLYRRVDWRWAQNFPPAITLGWSPDSGFLPYDWRGYNEGMILYVLALGSPTHAVGSDVWGEYERTYRWGTFYGQNYLAFPPLFGHQYSQVWIDFRGIRDDYMRAHGSDYFENSRRATYAQRGYAEADSGGWLGYDATTWGLTASDGPYDTTVVIAGRARRFRTYSARGASFTRINDDGTIAPTAAGGSVAFAPEIAIPALLAMRQRYGDNIFSTYGFVDAFNPTFTLPVKLYGGRVDPTQGWFDSDYLGIDEGPIVAMIENYRSGLVWQVMRRNPYIVQGLRRAGFRDGWIDQAPASPPPPPGSTPTAHPGR